MAEQRIYLQELYRELEEGGCGYSMPEDVAYGLLMQKYHREEQRVEQPAENLQYGRVVEMRCLSEEQHSERSVERCTGADRGLSSLQPLGMCIAYPIR